MANHISDDTLLKIIEGLQSQLSELTSIVRILIVEQERLMASAQENQKGKSTIKQLNLEN